MLLNNLAIIWQLLGDFGDYLAILRERHKIRGEELPYITELFRTGFGYKRWIK